MKSNNKTSCIAYTVIEMRIGKNVKFAIGCCKEDEYGYHPVEEYGPYDKEDHAQGVADRLNAGLMLGEKEVRQIIASTMRPSKYTFLTAEEMAEYLASLLTKEEMVNLFQLLDSEVLDADPNGGIFWKSMFYQIKRIAPEAFKNDPKYRPTLRKGNQASKKALKPSKKKTA
jgi:hypothetical protein